MSELINRKQLSKLTNVPYNSVWKKISKGKLPHPCKETEKGTCYWDRREAKKFVDKTEESPEIKKEEPKDEPIIQEKFNKIVNYWCAESPTPEQLTDLIKSSFQSGWQPMGGVAGSTANGRYIQALVKYDNS